MSIVDSAPEGGKFRAKAAAALDDTAGAWGDGNLLNVKIGSSGTLELAGITDAFGVILTTEGKRDNTHADYKKVEGGRYYTVFRRAIFVECDQWASPAATAGDTLYAAASGDVTTTPSDEAVYLGEILQGAGTTGMVFLLEMGGAAAAGVLGTEDLEFYAVYGAAAGDITVTGLAAADTLLEVLAFSKSVPVQTTVAGAAAGDVTVTDIATTDTLVSVIALGTPTPVQVAVAGGAAGDITVTGIATTDELISVLFIDIGGDAFADLTSEFSITAADTINNAGGTSSAAGFLLVMYQNLSADATADLTSEFSITAADTINNAGGTSSAGLKLLVLYMDSTSDEIADLTSEFTVSALNTINNAGGTSTLGRELIVIAASA